ncbi:hypothetical protein COY32_00885 [candidate division WWE3 bacterium CG_4_10_14_0_2_um_filter_41_14]|uniref:Uncharacterized protein n=1 Tax=candidate division WWE3 bacterium CG_4_10_14_0_2_um_filter_41_14 TaxID=1975072 RepID=A0A2M7TLF2_UNCKA|nr:MAG: hypothetical protein COY32_00885 [candidate division WWE3 bacterium CG_4_10_14_0_2_um_filter_41_14]
MSETFTVDIHTGLAGFTDLHSQFGVVNAVTFNNEIWGNMNGFLAPQTMQGLHHHFFTYLHALELFPLSEATVFITPYICPGHYRIKQERYKDYLEINPSVTGFSKKVEVEHRVFYEYDFMGQVKSELSKRWKITQFVESGVCNYSAAQLGSLYSYRLTKEDEAAYPPAAFNVAFMLN